jgi:hypothetical protein
VIPFSTVSFVFAGIGLPGFLTYLLTKGPSRSDGFRVSGGSPGGGQRRSCLEPRRLAASVGVLCCTRRPTEKAVHAAGRVLTACVSGCCCASSRLWPHRGGAVQSWHRHDGEETWCEQPRGAGHFLHRGRRKNHCGGCAEPVSSRPLPFEPTRPRAAMLRPMLDCLPP